MPHLSSYVMRDTQPTSDGLAHKRCGPSGLTHALQTKSDSNINPTPVQAHRARGLPSGSLAGPLGGHNQFCCLFLTLTLWQVMRITREGIHLASLAGPLGGRVKLCCMP